MQYAGIAIFALLAIALVLAVGWVLFHIGRVVICSIRDARSARQPPRELQHREFGTLTFRGSLWSGRMQQDGRTISFTVAGTESGPDAVLAERLSTAIASLRELKAGSLGVYSQSGARGSPSRLDLELIRFGYLLVIVITLFLIPWVWHLRGVL